MLVIEDGVVVVDVLSPSDRNHVKLYVRIEVRGACEFSRHSWKNIASLGGKQDGKPFQVCSIFILGVLD